MIGRASAEIAAGEDLPVPPAVDGQIETVRAARAAGFPCVMLQLRPGRTAEMPVPLHGALPDPAIRVDCHSGCRLEEAETILALDRPGRAMEEQPLAHDDPMVRAALAPRRATPVCRDGSITAPDRARKTIAIGACGHVSL